MLKVLMHNVLIAGRRGIHCPSRFGRIRMIQALASYYHRLKVVYALRLCRNITDAKGNVRKIYVTQVVAAYADAPIVQAKMMKTLSRQVSMYWLGPWVFFTVGGIGLVYIYGSVWPPSGVSVFVVFLGLALVVIQVIALMDRTQSDFEQPYKKILSGSFMICPACGHPLPNTSVDLTCTECGGVWRKK